MGAVPIDFAGEARAGASEPKKVDAWMLAGAPPKDLAVRVEGVVHDVSATAFQDRARDGVIAAGFSVGDWPGGPFLRGVIVGRRELYGHVLGERKLSDITPAANDRWTPAAMLLGAAIAIFVATIWIAYGGIYPGSPQPVLGVGLVCMVAVLVVALYMMPRQHQFEGEMLVVEYTAVPPPGQGQEVFNRAAEFRVVVSAGRALTKNVAGRGLGGRIVVRGIPGPGELAPYPPSVLEKLQREAAEGKPPRQAGDDPSP